MPPKRGKLKSQATPLCYLLEEFKLASKKKINYNNNNNFY
jgi:hypothetical protein